MLALMLTWALADGAVANTPPCALPDATPLSAGLNQGFCALPKDVRAFADRNSTCLYFSGEPPYDAQRRAELDRAIREHCAGNEATFAKLRSRHSDEPRVSTWLGRYGRETGLLPSP